MIKNKNLSAKIGRPATAATYQGVSVRFQTSPADENARLESVVVASGLSKAAFIQRATMSAVDAALKSGRIETKIPKASGRRQ